MNSDPAQRERIKQEAADWLAKLNSGEASFEDRTRFRRWVDASPLHREIYFELHKRWQHLEHAIAQTQAAPIATRRFSPALALAASLLLAVALFVLRTEVQDALLADYHTGVGEQKSVLLADGSTVILNADTALSVTFSANERRLRLLHGQAEFIVAYDRSRPFVVSAEQRSVTALGTEFSVESQDDRFTVTVFESAVRVKADGKALADLAQGEQLALYGNGTPQLNRHVDLGEALAWREGKLVFTAKPLGEVVQTINRHRPGKLLLLSPQAARLPVSGIFEQNQLDAMLPIMAGEMHLKLIRLGRYVTALY